MEPCLSGFALDPSKRSELTVNEKIELIHELIKRRQGVEYMLQSWSRKEILELLCAEMGKERKYTGLAKQKMIEILLRIVSEKVLGNEEDETHSTSHPSSSTSSAKRPRKADNPCRLPLKTCIVQSHMDNGDKDINKLVICQNLACRASLSKDDVFCKRCSCCICCKYDDNKDPSLWLVCSSNDSSPKDSCGMTCHLDCALKNEKTGIMEGMRDAKLDGSFYCASCGKMNDLLGCWKKQLIIAKEARRVDTLCYRMSLSHKLLNGTIKYQKSHQTVKMAMKKLETEVGSIDKLPSGMARGIVNRLPSSPEIQKLCILAIESLHSLSLGLPQSTPDSDYPNFTLSKLLKFENVSSTSLTLFMDIEDCSPVFKKAAKCSLWHRRADSITYPTDPTFQLVKPGMKFVVTELTAATEYLFKVVAFNDEKELDFYEVMVKTSSSEDGLESVAIQAETTPPTYESPDPNSSDASNHSDGNESNTDPMYEDLNCSRQDSISQSMKTDDPNLGKSKDRQETTNLHAARVGCITNKVPFAAPAEIPGCSVSSLDEEPDESAQATGITDLTNLSGLKEGKTFEGNLNVPTRNEENTRPSRNSESVLPDTPSKLEASKETTGSSGKMILESDGLETWRLEPGTGVQVERPPGKYDAVMGKVPIKKNGLQADYEYCVKVIRWLECNGFIETSFRMKFLTWLSLQATSQERGVVSVFVDTLIDDPPSLAGQLVDTFSEGICSNKRPPDALTGFCMKLWH